MKITNEKVFGIDICIGIPTGELAGIVDRFFELKGNPSFIAHRLFPGGYSEILFNLGDVLHASISSSKNENRRITCRQFLVSGIKTGYFDVTSPVNMHCVGVRFKVDGIKRLFEISPAEFTDNDFNLDEIIARSAAHNLYESLAECRTPVERFNLLSRLLIKKLISSKNDYTAESIVKRVLSRPFLSINNLEKETGYSRQYLHRVFKSFTGISIKKFQQINRAIVYLALLIRVAILTRAILSKILSSLPAILPLHISHRSVLSNRIPTSSSLHFYNTSDPFFFSFAS
jgi:AraC-like DNA-binding protein